MEDHKLSDPFEDQFAKTEKFKVAGGTAEVFDIRPETADAELPVLLAQGWGMTAEVNKPALKVMAGENRRAIFLNHPRIGWNIDESLENLGISKDKASQYPVESLRRALNILEVLDKKGIEKADVVACSFGASDIEIAAELKPEKFRTLILVGPAGMIGEDSYMRLSKGFLGQRQRAGTLKGQAPDPTKMIGGRPEIPLSETEREVAASAAKEAAIYSLKNPARSLREIWEIKKSQIHERLRELHTRGIGIGIISGVDDPVFPQDKINEIAKADMLDGYLSVRGGHGAVMEHPELYMKVALNMAKAIAEKKEREKVDQG
ncbi:MAG: hypothetical protein A3H71_03660 [Candidatus Sungbacteria bacterium RIFCSPLOWO2_02_FULL_48_13b]|uniref:AB hydrolase-1 domain-containing protein n=1 Tax=Candidatus Sungbacteria bacterium RIFCSPLOWO2_02_FULL_48_13b TaxID=1802283 RepID=A0A1G2LFT0_9BACT|nr:MAG: hypothetical protein A3H71_03660 [Candidatus Sungbacteria bacterium RIFCSPLOWO2_02_FULL_48_13b]